MVVRETNKYRIEKESGLIDDCKYMLYFKNGWHNDGYHSVPVRTIKEAIEWVNGATLDEEYESIKEVAKEDLIMYLSSYYACDEDYLNELGKEKEEFYFECIKEMTDKCIKIIRK